MHEQKTMTERSVEIAVPNTELAVHGVLRGDFVGPLAILAPGLGGWMHDLLLFNASRYFETCGISTLRVSFYGGNNNQRNIGDFDVKTNAADIDTVVEYARQQGASWICVIGHSYSGMAIVYSQKQAFDAAVLWDPSHTDGYTAPQAQENLAKDFTYVKKLDSYVSAKGSGYVLSRKVFEDYAPGSAVMARQFNIPTLVANASNTDAMIRYGRSYAEQINALTTHMVIPDSSHPFTEDGAMERLFEATANWIKTNCNTKELV